MHDTKQKKIRHDKLLFKWKGPYRVKTIQGKTYTLEELNRVAVKGSFMRDRLRPYFGRSLEMKTPDVDRNIGV